MARNRDFEVKPQDKTSLRKGTKAQRVILVGVGLQSDPKNEFKESLLELIELTETAGAEVVGTTFQVLEKFVARTLIGSGKVQEIAKLVEETEANLVILDHELSGAQTLNLESELKVAVLDRTQLILDIFAQRAQTHEGKLQVELAQMLDQLPRMVGAFMGSLSRQGGGIGTRGPGETALEQDRRRIHTRIEMLKKQLDLVRNQRYQHRHARKRNKVPSFAVIGYTNAGKSTLVNKLTGSDVYAENKLFATLDPTTRKVFLPGGPGAVMTDTVGFIRRLPTKLIEAFKATLEESGDADILIHVLDLSSDQMDRHYEVVNELIKEFKWNEKPIIHVYNKVDVASEAKKLSAIGFPRVLVSAQTGAGLEQLRQMMIDGISNLQEEVGLYLPREEAHLLYEIGRECKIVSKEESNYGFVIRALMTPAAIHKWQAYIQR